MSTPYKHLGLVCIKYMPSILALACSVKIMLLTMSDANKDQCLYAVNWINLALSLVVLAAFYCLGKAFGYCWKHRSLCRITFWGLMFYAFFLIVRVPKDEVLPLTYMYVLIVIIFTLLYREIK